MTLMSEVTTLHSSI